MRSTAIQPTEIKEETTPIEKLSGLGRVPKDILKAYILPLLDAKSAASLSGCSLSLFTEIRGINYWRGKLLSLGCDKEELQTVINANVITNYAKLYRALHSLNKHSYPQLKAWELYCLSGEIPAIQHVIEEKVTLTKHTVGVNRCSALHYTAVSGSVSAMKFVIEILKIDYNPLDAEMRNITYYAILSGSAKAKQYAKTFTSQAVSYREIFNTFIDDFNSSPSRHILTPFRFLLEATAMAQNPYYISNSNRRF